MKDNNVFEEKIKKLENIVETMEKEDLGIEKTLELFQEGMGLSRECKKIMENIELKVNKIMASENMTEDDVENIRTEPFSADIQ